MINEEDLKRGDKKAARESLSYLVWKRNTNTKKLILYFIIYLLKFEMKDIQDKIGRRSSKKSVYQALPSS